MTENKSLCSSFLRIHNLAGDLVSLYCTDIKYCIVGTLGCFIAD